MLQPQSSEKLHAACDECRSRKLKCSGETPQCVRCKREKINCVYSPQKQMGRPRKRRRDGEAEDSLETPVSGSMTTLSPSQNIMRTGYSEFGIVTPPQQQESSYLPDGSLAPTDPPFVDLCSTETFGFTPTSSADLSVDPPIDPSLWDMSFMPTQPDDSFAQYSVAPCSCLSLMYLTLTELQSVTSFEFPRIIVPLRKAMSTLSDLIHCAQCPKEPFSAIQNISSIVALFKAIAERFHKVLATIEEEAVRLEQSGEKKPYRIGDNNPALHHLHTGTPDCPLGFNIEIEAKDWKKLAKASLKTEIYGNGSNPRPLMMLLKETIDRQAKWHEDREHCAVERRHVFGVHQPVDGRKPCEALGADHIKRIIDGLNWD